MIPRGTRFTSTVRGQAGGYLHPLLTRDDVEQSIRTELVNRGFAVAVVNVRPEGTIAGAVLGGALPDLVGTWSFTATVAVRTTFDYSQDVDAIYQLGQGVLDATGYVPSVSVQSWGDDVDPAVNGADDNGAPGFFADLLNRIEGDAGKVLIGVAVVGVILVVAIGWSPNAPKLARIQL